MTRAALLISFALNIVLGAVLLIRSGEPVAVGTVEDSQPGSPLASPAAHSSADSDLKGYYQTLLSKDLGEQERASLLLASLREQHERQMPVPPYWKSDSRSVTSAVLSEQAGVEVLAAVGDTALENPAFGVLFRPLRREYPSLSARKQMEVHQLLRSYYQGVERIGPQSNPAAYTRLRDAAHSDLHANVQKALTPDEYAEFVMRASPLADAVRKMGLDIDEAPYRQLMKILSADQQLIRVVLRHERYRPDMKSYTAQLSEVLGKEQYARFASSIDPVGATVALGRSGSSLAGGCKPGDMNWSRSNVRPVLNSMQRSQPAQR